MFRCGDVLPATVQFNRGAWAGNLGVLGQEAGRPQPAACHVFGQIAGTGVVECQERFRVLAVNAGKYRPTARLPLSQQPLNSLCVDLGQAARYHNPVAERRPSHGGDESGEWPYEPQWIWDLYNTMKRFGENVATEHNNPVYVESERGDCSLDVGLSAQGHEELRLTHARGQTAG